MKITQLRECKDNPFIDNVHEVSDRTKTMLGYLVEQDEYE